MCLIYQTCEAIHILVLLSLLANLTIPCSQSEFCCVTEEHLHRSSTSRIYIVWGTFTSPGAFQHCWFIIRTFVRRNILACTRLVPCLKLLLRPEVLTFSNVSLTSKQFTVIVDCVLILCYMIYGPSASISVVLKQKLTFGSDTIFQIDIVLWSIRTYPLLAM